MLSQDLFVMDFVIIQSIKCQKIVKNAHLKFPEPKLKSLRLLTFFGQLEIQLHFI